MAVIDRLTAGLERQYRIERELGAGGTQAKLSRMTPGSQTTPRIHLSLGPGEGELRVDDTPRSVP